NGDLVTFAFEAVKRETRGHGSLLGPLRAHLMTIGRSATSVGPWRARSPARSLLRTTWLARGSGGGSRFKAGSRGKSPLLSGNSLGAGWEAVSVNRLGSAKRPALRSVTSSTIRSPGSHSTWNGRLGHPAESSSLPTTASRSPYGLESQS